MGTAEPLEMHAYFVQSLHYLCKGPSQPSYMYMYMHMYMHMHMYIHGRYRYAGTRT